MTQMAKSSLLDAVESLNILIYKSFPHEEIGDDFCYILPSGEYCSLRYVQDYDCIFFEYAKNRNDMQLGLTTDGAWLHVYDYEDINDLYRAVVNQFNS